MRISSALLKSGKYPLAIHPNLLSEEFKKLANVDLKNKQNV